MKKNFLGIICFVLISAMVFGLCGCSGGKEAANDGKIEISIGDWPAETNKANYKEYIEKKEMFEKKYPNITIKPDNWAFSTDTFLPKAAGGTLPTMYNLPVTEVDKVVNAGYAMDITDKLEEYGYSGIVKEEIMNLCSRNDKCYFIPIYAYSFGLYMNLNLFKEIGAVDEDGTVHAPDTYEELGEMAQKIKEKTGKAGFAFPTMNNMGGWHFMNIAYSFGAEFEEQDENGKWHAIFNSPECEAALNFVKDLKWKYDALPDNNLISITDVTKQFATDQAAMYFLAPHDDSLTVNYGMSKDAIGIGKMPKGPAGRYALMGGGLYAFSNNSTPEQIDACFKWIDFIGQGAKFNNDQAKINLEDNYKTKVQEGYLVGYTPYNQWKEGSEKFDFEQELIKKYANVNLKHVEQFADFSDTIIKPEPVVNCQELYTALDECIQQVLLNKDADVKAILEKANAHFQKDYLDSAN